MKRLMIRLSVALLTFCIGIFAALFYFARTNPPVNVLQSKQIEKTSPQICFQGQFIEIGASNPQALLYFPQGVFSENQWQNQFRVDWYSKHLRAMGEPSLLSNMGCEGYRFLWLRSFHHPVAVRVWRTGDVWSLVVKQLSGAGGYEPGNLVFNETRSLTESERKEFVSLLEKTSYWQMPVKEDRLMADGARWILEGVKDGRYHIVDRQSPESGNYRQACRFLLKITGVKIPNEEIY